MLAQAFAKVETCDRAFYQHNDSNMVVWMKNISIPKKIVFVTSTFMKIQYKRTMYYQRCFKFSHTKKNIYYSKKIFNI